MPFDYVLLALIVVIGGSAFALIHIAVETVPPTSVAAGRLWIGSIFLLCLMRLKKRRFPPLIVRAGSSLRPHKAWVWMAGVGMVGNVIPFILFPWAQQVVTSGAAGVYMSFMPIWTLTLAVLFAGEKPTASVIAGFALGLAGVAILLGPAAFTSLAQANIAAQLGLLTATALYAMSAVMARRAPPMRPLVFAAGLTISAAIIVTPIALLQGLGKASWTPTSVAALVGLGIGPTGLGGLLIVMLIKRAGASFMAFSNYLSPVWAVALGALAFGEAVEPRILIALAVILAGAVTTRRKPEL